MEFCGYAQRQRSSRNRTWCFPSEYELSACSYLGNVYPSPSSTNLFHVAGTCPLINNTVLLSLMAQGCDQFSSLVYALRVNSPLGEKHPVLQLAFAFYHVPPNGPPRRVLRVHTIRLPVSKNWHSLYAGIETEVVGAYVVQKVRHKQYSNLYPTC